MNEKGARTTAGERRAATRYMWEIMAGAIGFLVTFLFLPRFFAPPAGSLGSIALALVPLVPVLWIVIALTRHIRRIDELQRGIAQLSLAIAFGAAMLIALTVAFLSTAGIAVSFPEWWVFIGGMGVWGITIGVLSMRASR